MTENKIDLLKTDLNNSWYNYLYTVTLILILKNIILFINMLKNNIYDLTIMAMIHFVFIFSLQNIKY